MKTIHLLIYLIALLPLSGQEGIPLPENSKQASKILSQVRYAYPQKTLNFRGEIRPRRIGFKMIPLNLSFNSQLIKFEFFSENNSTKIIDETISLDFRDDKINVLRAYDSLTKEIKDDDLSNSIRGTDISYDDIVMRFLDWPNPVLLKIEKAKGGKAWKIRCANPNKSQLYSIVDVWVSQRSGAIVRMNAYNKKRRIVKSFEVDSIQQIKGDWFVETMIVRTYPEDGKSKPTSSFLKLVPKK
tara:strand:- start:639 stop:1364 length:726 start_codon:yes stop_codon:yes gene_type:complete